MSERLRVGVLTVSDRCAQGLREDEGGPAIAAWCASQGYEVAARGVVPDETSRIVPVLLEWCDAGKVDLLLTTGGTGLSPRDVTPEATATVLERSAPGIAEALRARGREATPYASLSRGMAGVRAATLVVNLPGSPAGVVECLQVLAPLAVHAVELLHGRQTPHHRETPREG